MIKLNAFLFFFLFLLLNITAQSDSVVTEGVVLSNQEEVEALLPNHYLLSQKLLWSENGLMRKCKYFDYTYESRKKEVEIRRTMIKAHRLLGYVTVAAMLGQAFVGAKVYSDRQKFPSQESEYKSLHAGLSTAINIGYFTTAGLVFFAPPSFKDRPKGFSTAKLHKYMSVLHLSSMITALITADKAGENETIRNIHRASAFTAFGSFYVAMAVIHF